MPIDPATGERLPYAGEPGAPAGAPPMPPGGPGMAPPGPPMDPGAAGPEDLAAAEQQEAMAKMEAIAATAPQPKKPYSVKSIQTFAGEVDSAIDALAGTDIPLPEWSPEAGGDKGDQPLPLEVYAPAVALVEAVRALGDKKFDKHLFEPTELFSDSELKAASGKVRSMSKDKGLMSALQAPMGGAEEEAPEEGGELPPPDQMSPEDETLMGAM